MIRRLFGSQLRRNMVTGPVMVLVKLVTAMVAYPLYLHWLGYEKYGVWLILATVLSLIQMGGNLGIEPALTKLVAEEWGRGNLAAVQRYVTMAMTMVIAASTAALCGIVAFRYAIIAAFGLTGENAEIGVGLLPYVAAFCVYLFVVRVLNATLSGLGRMDLRNNVDTVGGVVVPVIAFGLFRAGWGVESLLVANTLSHVFMHVALLFFIRRTTRLRLFQRGNWSMDQMKMLLRFGTPIMGGSFVNMLLSPFNKLMLARYAGAASVPVYEIAYSGSMLLRNLLEAGFRAIMPEISRIGGENTEPVRQRVADIYSRAFRLMQFGGVVLFLSCLAIVLLTPAIQWWLRDKYVDMLRGVFAVMLVSAYISLLGVPAYYALMGLGRARMIFISHVGLSAVNIVVVAAMALLVPPLTVMSVACATAAAMAVSTVYLIQQKGRAASRKTARGCAI